MTATDNPAWVVKDLLAKARPIRSRPSIAWLILAIILAIATHSIYRDWSQPITGEHLMIIRKLVAHNSATSNIPPEQVWQRVYDRFEIGSPLDLRDKQFSESVKFIVSVTRAAE